MPMYGRTLESSTDSGALVSPHGSRGALQREVAGVRVGSDTAGLRGVSLGEDAVSSARAQRSISLVDSAERPDTQSRRGFPGLATEEWLLSEVSALASKMASEDFRASPAKRPNDERIEAELKRILSEHPHLVNEDLVKRALSQFNDAYRAKTDSLFSSELSWIERSYYRTRRFFSQAIDISGTVVKGLASLGSMMASGMETLVAEGIPKLASRELWNDVGSALMRGAETLTSAEFWNSVGNGIVAGHQLLVRGAEALINNPGAALSAVWGGIRAISDSMGVTDIVRGVGRMFTGDFAGGLEALKGGARLLCEVTGLADAWGAVKHLGLGVYALGQGDKAGFYVHVGQAAMHGAFAAMSIGSIAATVATGGAAAGAVVGVVLLRQSLKSAAKTVLKTAAKEFLECAGKEIGEKVVKEFGEKIGVERLAQASRDLVDSGTKDVLNDVLGTGGAAKLMDTATPPAVRERLISKAATELTPGKFESVFRENAEKLTDALMKEGKIEKLVEKHSSAMLNNVNKKSARKLARELVDSGLVRDPAYAKRMAAEMKSALKKDYYRRPHIEADKNYFDSIEEIGRHRKNGEAQRGQADQMMKAVLSEGVSREVREYVEKGMKKEFGERLSQGLSGQLRDPASKALSEVVERQAKTLGRDVDSLVKEYVDASWKGAREGIESATKKAVRHGVDDAFTKFRKSSLPHKVGIGLGAALSAAGLADAGGGVMGDHLTDTDRADRRTFREEKEDHRGSLQYDTRSYRRGLHMVRDVLVRSEGGKWEIAHREEMGIAEFAEDQLAKRAANLTKGLLSALSPGASTHANGGRNGIEASPAS